jgi:AraC-like DNA-binding protein
MDRKIRLINNQLDFPRSILVQQKQLFQVSSLHCHDFYELELIVSGSGQTTLNGTGYPLESGVTFLLTPEDFHEIRTNGGMQLYTVQFAPDCIESTLLDRLTVTGDKIGRLPDSLKERIIGLLEMILALDQEKETDRQCAGKLLEAILILLCDRLTNEKRNHQAPPLQKVIVYIHAHFKENPPLQKMADLLYLNERYFCTAFHRYTGMSYKNYLRRVKLEYAARLITSTTLSVTEIAAESGYASLSHFGREFKAFYGLSPLEMRTNKQKNGQPF